MSTAVLSPSLAQVRETPTRYWPAAHPPASRLRLTQRGRVVLTTLIAAPLVTAAVMMVLNGGIAEATIESSPASFEYVSIEPGQSLWQLAETIAPQADPREVISDIAQLNQLDSVEVQPGQRLAIPSAYSD